MKDENDQHSERGTDHHGDDSDNAALLPAADPELTDAEKLSKDEGRTEEDQVP